MRFAFFLSLLLLCGFAFASPASAMSEADYRKYSLQAPEFVEAEKRLADAWKALQKAASPEHMKRYKTDQGFWVREEQDEWVNSLIDLHSKGWKVPEAALDSGKVNKAKAYALVTSERAALLTELARQEADAKYQPSFTGKITSGHNKTGGYYQFTPEGWWTSLILCYYGGEDELSADTKKFLEDLPDDDDKAPLVLVKGQLESVTLFLEDKSLTLQLAK